MRKMTLTILLSFGALASETASESDLNKTVIGDRVYPAAIVVEKYDKKVNLKDYGDFFQDVDSVCFNGSLDDALVVSNLIYDDIWIYDEFQLYNIKKEKSSIKFDVLDEKTYNDMGASVNEIGDFIQTYTARACQ